MTIPKSFSDRIIRMRGDSGRAWLSSLSETIPFCEKYWRLKLSEPYDLSYNYVVRADDPQAVVKICLPGPSFRSELNALMHYDGHGLCRLTDFIEDRSVLLLEMLRPGLNIKTLDERDSINAVCAVIREMRSLNSESRNAFLKVSDLPKEIQNMKEHFSNGSGPFDNKIVAKAEQLLPDLISTQKDIYVLHGDLHHGNILSHGKGWKAIDPKGVLGEVEYELIPFLMNNLPVSSGGEVVDARIARFHRQLGVDVQRVYAWGLCRALLSAWWNIEDNLGTSDANMGLIDHFNKKTEAS